MSLTAGSSVGRYQIQNLLGSGGMGEVYKAVDSRLQRTVAVKVLPHAHTRDSRDRGAGQPWATLEQLEEHAAGLVCLSGCARDGVLAGAFAGGDPVQ